MNISTILELFVLFQIKHFLADFPLQVWPYMFANKGTYGHPGGILHAIIHFLGTLIVLLCVKTGIFVSLLLSALDFVIHYHVDFLKMKTNAHFKLTPQTSWFWILLGIDQLFHQLTYILIVAIVLL